MAKAKIIEIFCPVCKSTDINYVRDYDGEEFVKVSMDELGTAAWAQKCFISTKYYKAVCRDCDYTVQYSFPTKLGMIRELQTAVTP